MLFRSAALRLRWLVLLLALGVGLAGGWLFSQMKSELSPTEDRGTIIINASAPEGASFGYTQRYAAQAEELGLLTLGHRLEQALRLVLIAGKLGRLRRQQQRQRLVVDQPFGPGRQPSRLARIASRHCDQT